MKDLMVSAHFSFKVVGERARRLKYARGLSALSVTTTKPIGCRPKTNWAVSLGVGRNPESVQEYLHEMLVPHDHAYKHDNI